MGTHAISLSRFKKHRAVPVVALVSATMLVSGQLLNCCQLNESLSGMLAKAFHSVGLFHSHEAVHDSEAASHGHPNCHSHGLAEATSSDSPVALAAEAGQKHLEAHESCLSEHAFVVQAQASNNHWLAALPIQVRDGRCEDLVNAPARVERPRPQNKAGPPVYLLTLRLLV